MWACPQTGWTLPSFALTVSEHLKPVFVPSSVSLSCLLLFVLSPPSLSVYFSHFSFLSLSPYYPTLPFFAFCLPLHVSLSLVLLSEVWSRESYYERLWKVEVTTLPCGKRAQCVREVQIIKKKMCPVILRRENINCASTSSRGNNTVGSPSTSVFSWNYEWEEEYPVLESCWSLLNFAPLANNTEQTIVLLIGNILNSFCFDSS